MEVYKFNKCLLDRLEESMLVLPWKEEIITAPQVKQNWISFLELQMEPAGWQAIWNVPRVICEVLNLRYPTSVFGYVEQVLYRELRAIFVVEAVQDEDVQLKERHEVALEELWPTICQENNALNVERTAESLDSFRFFYSHVWMPWDNDNDDDLNWVEKHLESRIRFCYDLRKGCIKRKVAQHIRSLLTEAKYIQQRREFLELGLSDDEADDETSLENIEVTELMRLHLRLSMIRNEIEILENSEMRRIYEEVHLCDTDNTDKTKDVYSDENDRIKRTKADYSKNCFIITQLCTLGRHLELLRSVEKLIDSNCQVELSPLLLDALTKCERFDKIFLTPGKHKLKFLEYLNEDGYMSGIVTDFSDSQNNENKNLNENQAIIISPDDDSVLLVFNGNYTLENIVFDCHNVRTGILLKLCGNVTLRNCRLTGDGKSSTQQGIVCNGKTKLTLMNCTIEKFAIGIVMQKGSEVTLKNSKILDCKTGLDINACNTRLHVKHFNIINSKKCGIHVENLLNENLKTKSMKLETFNHLSKLSTFMGDCQFKNCKTNIFVLNGKMAIITADSLASIRDESDNDEYQDGIGSSTSKANN